VNRYDKAGLNDIGLAMTVDSSGNPVVAGIQNNGTNNDAVTIKYDPSNGNRTWVREYNNGFADTARDVAADGSGNVYISGWSEMASGNADYLAIKYNSSGTALWTSRVNGTANNVDIGQRVVVDASGNVYMTGWSHNGGNFDYLTVKFNSSGTKVWSASYDSGAGDFGHALAVDALGNVAVTGRSVTGGGNTTYDIVTLHYSSAGVLHWTNRYDRAGLNDIGLAMTVNSAGNPIVAGIENNGTNNDAVSIRYDVNTGARQWIAHYNNGFADTARDVTVNGSGDVFLSGWSESAVGNADYLTIKYLNLGP
jgi:hypothetical protein